METKPTIYETRFWDRPYVEGRALAIEAGIDKDRAVMAALDKERRALAAELANGYATGNVGDNAEMTEAERVLFEDCRWRELVKSLRGRDIDIVCKTRNEANNLANMLRYMAKTLPDFAGCSAYVRLDVAHLRMKNQ